MHETIARTMRYLARLTNQHTARTNAAEGSATLRRRRHDQEQVDDYLQGRTLTVPASETEAGQRGDNADATAL
jgi:hypothetical protein